MNYKSIPGMFFGVCDKFNKEDAVQIKKDGKYEAHSHKFFKQHVTHFARGLMALGLKENEHVGLLAETRFEWAVADMGNLVAGGVTVPLYPSLPADEVHYILENSESVGVVVSNDDQLVKIMAIKERLPLLRFVVVIEPEKQLPDGVHTMDEVEALGAKKDNEDEMMRRAEAKNRDDLLTIIYTSGTTGKPKGVMLTHGNLLSNVEGCLEIAPMGPEDTCLSHLPLSHVLERMGGYYMMLAAGVSIAYAEDISTLSENLNEIKPTVMVSVPRLFEKIYARIVEQVAQGSPLKKRIFYWALGVAKESLPFITTNRPVGGLLGLKYSIADTLVFEKIRAKTGGRLKFMVSGGAALPKEIAEVFIGIGLKITEGYGLTETSPVLAVNLANHIKPGTVGPALSNVEIKIAEDGEIICRGPNIMVGYYKNEEATKEAIQNGWFHTGDIGEFDQDGFLKITDRKKEILVTSGGKNVAPQPLESSLKLAPHIEQAVVVGDGRKFIAALVVPPWDTIADWAPRDGFSTNPKTLVQDEKFKALIEKEIQQQQKDFAGYEQVKKFVLLPQYLSEEGGELTPSMKVKRKVIKEKYAKQIDQMYQE
jgi:long-chain acyl-CoA synthetase